MKTTATTQNNNSGNRREFADYERVIVTGDWGHSAGRPVTQEVATVHAYDSETGKYWVIFRSGHGNGNSWHDPAHLCDSWAMQHPAAILWEGRAGLIFRVNALQHRGNVIVLLDEGRDLYDVRTLSDKGETIEERRGIFGDDLATVIDEMVERPATMTDAEYIAALRKLGNPMLNWLLDKREAGQEGKIILV